MWKKAVAVVILGLFVVGFFAGLTSAEKVASPAAPPVSSTIKIESNHPLADTIPPVVNITSPVNHSIVTGSVDIKVNITDNIAVQIVYLYADSTLLATSPVSLKYNWSPSANGHYLISAIGYDTSNNTDYYSIDVNVLISGSSNHIPIKIDSDADFNIQYPSRIINGFNIEGPGWGSCIIISNCTKPFTVQNCIVYHRENRSYMYDWGSGIYILNCTAGFLFNNTCYNNTYGIDIVSCQGINSTQNILFGNDAGIEVALSRKTQVLGNNLSLNTNHGIILWSTDNNTVEYNRCNLDEGIVLYNSSDCLISNNNNTMSGGIGLAFSNNNLIARNSFFDCYSGIHSWSCSKDNKICENIINNSRNFGIYLEQAYKHTITGNKITSANISIFFAGGSHNKINYNELDNSLTYGIVVTSAFIDWNIYEPSEYNEFRNNSLRKSSGYGIYIESIKKHPTDDSRFNRIFWNNLIKNNPGKKQAFDDIGTNFWNSSYPSGGNYWSDWIGPDNNTDGIVDFAYYLDGGTKAADLFPLVNPVKTSAPPVPDSPPPVLALVLLIILPIIVAVWRRE
jgi:parallel beta-helix repeat protein